MSDKRQRKSSSPNPDVDHNRSKYMPRLRQMPELFLRGALANQTMKNLTPDQQDEVARVTSWVTDHPKLAPNRAEFIKQLGRTIGGDYREDRSTADQEFRISIWRGVVHLLYHCSYSYVCEACGNSTYLTQRNKPSAMNQSYPVCPSCRCVRITDTGDTDLIIGSFMAHDAFQGFILTVPMGKRGPSCGSPVVPITGGKKVDRPEDILDDPAQLLKFFSEFIWNYFRQVLKENEITYHQKEPQHEYGPADRMAVLEIISLLGKLRTPHQYNDCCQPEAGVYHIYCQTASTPPEFTAEYTNIVRRYAEHGVKVRHTETEFMVPEVPKAPMVDALVVRPSPVLMSTTQSRIGANGEEPSSYAVERLEYTTTGENSVSAIDNKEVLAAIRAALPDGECLATFDIITGTGEIWDRFSQEYGDREPRAGHMATFLGTTPRAIAAHKESIKLHMFSHDFVPGSIARDED